MHLTRALTQRVTIAVVAAIMIVGVLAWVSPGSASAAPAGISGLTSATHPSESVWYSSNSPSFSWSPSVATDAGIAGYSIVLDQHAGTIPDTVTDRSSLTFLPRVTYTVGSHPAENYVADLNGDGNLDLVVENSASDNVSVMLGNGDGTLQPKVDYATGDNPWSMALGDVNSDGNVDVVTGNSTASSVSVLLGNGDGTLRAKVDYTTGAGTTPECLRMADIRSNGHLDIFTANAGTNNVSVLLNNGDGTFGAPSTFAASTHPTSIDVGDVNGDSRPDLITANYSGNNVSVLLGIGDGTFHNASNYAVSPQPQTVRTADFNRDGKLDIATVNWGNNTASILLNNGDGTFASKVDYAIGNGPYAFSVADLNHDGAPDLVTTNHTANSVSILYGNGDGTFAAKTDIATGGGPFWVALGDLNGDGYGDLMTTDESDGQVSVHLSTAFLAASYSGKADGVWYFHVRAVDTKGAGGSTTTRVVRIDTPKPDPQFATAPTVNGQSTGTFTIGTTQPIAWTMGRSVGGGSYFKVVADCPSTSTSALLATVPADGGSSYSVDWPITQAAADDWHVTVQLYNAADTQIASSDSAALQLAQTGIAVTAPAGDGSCGRADALPVSWTASATVATGQFSVWAVSSNGWYVGKIVHAHGAGAHYNTSIDLDVPASRTYRIYVFYRATPDDPWGPYGVSAGTETVTGFEDIEVTAPEGGGRCPRGSTLPVAWNTNESVASGQFSIWAVSGSNGWYVGKIVDAHADSTDYTSAIDLDVPTGGGYRVYVYYRANAGDPWGLYGHSAGAFAVSGFNAIDVTAPEGGGSHAIGASMSVAWTTDAVVDSGQFSVWAVSRSNRWHVGKIVDAHGDSAEYDSAIDLNLPAGDGYSVYVYYRTSAGRPWKVYGRSAGTFAVTGLDQIDVTAPSGTGSYTAGDSLAVTWHTNETVSSGQFSVWAVSRSNGWYVGKIVDAHGDSADYSTGIDLDVPIGSGYRVYVYYRANAGDPWGVYGYSSGTFSVAGGQPDIRVTSPGAGGSYAQASVLPVSWRLDEAASSGEFSIWLVAADNTWYGGKIVPAVGDTTEYASDISLDEPAGSGYRLFVFYRATPSDPWGAYAFSAGSFTVDPAP